MIYIDTHTHTYLKQFDVDRIEAVKKAIDSGVKYMLLPNIDDKSVEPMLEICDVYPDNCFPMLGLHPTDVKSNVQENIAFIEKWLSKRKFYAIGETGIDLYWDKTFLKEQEISFRYHLDLAINLKLPIVIHVRDSMNEAMEILKDYKNMPDLKGVFHCYSGNVNEAKKVLEYGFYLGIGGVVTYKKAELANVVRDIDLKHFVLETDAPFLSPVPYRGKRNESGYIPIIAQKIAEIKNISQDEVARVTTENAINLFNL